MSLWQLIFVQSKVNNARYDGDRFLAQNWDWPKETWFQMRLCHLRKLRKNSEELTQPRLAADSSLAM
jgi:hypothetical protein